MKDRKEITLNLKIIESRENGGRIRINTDAVDRDNDRVYPDGAQFENYLQNPVVLWGHNYRDASAVIGRTNSIEHTPEYIDVDFDLREAANESDPQNIVRLLWNQGFVRTASIGFYPLGEISPNDVGGFDFRSWELLEWSLVPVPSNQEALRLAVKGLLPKIDEENLTGSDSVPKSYLDVMSEIGDLGNETDKDDTTIEKDATIAEDNGTGDVHPPETDNQKDSDGDDEPTNDNPPNDESETGVNEFFSKANQIIKETFNHD